MTWSKPTTATTVRELPSSVMAEDALASRRGRREQHSRRELRRKESREAITASYARGKTACVRIHTKDETNKDTRNRRRQTRAHHANTAEAAN